jgi:hypothetical protein
MDKEVTVQTVEVKETRNGNKRYVLRDTDGGEYTTFRPPIGEEAAKHEGKRVRIKFHEQERNGFTNVYLDSVEPLAGGEHEDRDGEEAAWQTAVEAAPWLVGKREVPPDELFDKLKPFQERVAADIRDGDDE